MILTKLVAKGTLVREVNAVEFGLGSSDVTMVTCCTINIDTGLETKSSHVWLGMWWLFEQQVACGEVKADHSAYPDSTPADF